MVPKGKLLILGFFATVVLISFEVTARDLAKASSISTKFDASEEKNDAIGVKYNKNISTRDDIVHPDWFIIPWIPKIPWIPWIPWIPKIPLIPGVPGGGAPGGGYGGPGEPSAPGGGYGGPGEPSAPGGGYGGPGGAVGPGEPGGPSKPGEPDKSGGPTDNMTPRMPGGGSGGFVVLSSGMKAKMHGGDSPSGGIGRSSQKDYYGGHI